ncbi:hypothetical protein TNCV_3819961 [Trichonephila clavipes]|uniref:Uncharacterized protein n=1 Tax=Trichonephila clavipes TaxID=2585209 RepID=A0A8X6R2P3_TRICX|nr:hypothetical protein TNCV_3819961 [Trichonephila clavipes]
MPPNQQRPASGPRNSSWQRAKRRLSLAVALSTMQVTVRFGSVSPQFGGRTLWRGQRPPTSLLLPPTSPEDLRFDGYLEVPPCREGTIHLQISMSSPGFIPSAYAQQSASLTAIPNERQVDLLISIKDKLF